MCARPDESTPDLAPCKSGNPPASTATPSDRRSPHRPPSLSSTLIAASFLLYSYQSSSQDGQNSRPTRPQRVKARGGTNRTSCGPFVPRMDLGERKSPSVIPTPEAC